MPQGRTPGRHDGRDAEVRRFSPLPLRRHPSSRLDDTLTRTRFKSLLAPGRSVPSLASPSRFISPVDVLLFEESRENHHPHSRQGILGGVRRSPSFSPFVLTLSPGVSSRRHDDLQQRERRLYLPPVLSPLEAIANAISPVITIRILIVALTNGCRLRRLIVVLSP